MTGEFWVINSEAKLSSLITHIEKEWQERKWLKIQIQNATHRSLDQNDLSFELYNRIGQAMYGGDSDLARRECKLRHGVPLLRENDPQFKQIYDSVIKGQDYETKLKIMAYLPVTSRMSKKVFTQYANRVIDAYSAEGVDLHDFS